MTLSLLVRQPRSAAESLSLLAAAARLTDTADQRALHSPALLERHFSTGLRRAEWVWYLADDPTCIVSGRALGTEGRLIDLVCLPADELGADALLEAPLTWARW